MGVAKMNVVHLADCMEFMKTVPDKYYELAMINLDDFPSQESEDMVYSE